MASQTGWTWVWVNSGSWWWTGRPGMLQFMGLQRVGHDWVTELNWPCFKQWNVLNFNLDCCIMLETQKSPRSWGFMSLPQQSLSYTPAQKQHQTMSCLLVYHTHFYKNIKKFVSEMYLTLLSVLSMVGPHNVWRERNERTEASEMTPCSQSFTDQSSGVPGFCVHSPDQL